MEMVRSLVPCTLYFVIKQPFRGSRPRFKSCSLQAHQFTTKSTSTHTLQMHTGPQVSLPIPADPMSGVKAARVQLFPRRKAGDTVHPEKGRQPIKVDLNTIYSMFGMPQPEAARLLGLSLTALKQVCRKLGVSRWPYTRACKRFQRHHDSSLPGAEVICPSLSAPSTSTPPSIKIAGDNCPVKSAAAPSIIVTEEDSSDFDSNADTARYLESSDDEWEHSVSRCASSDHQDAQAPAPHMHKLISAASACDEAATCDDHDLGWLVSEQDRLDTTVGDEWMIEMAWRERLLAEFVRSSNGYTI